MNISEDLKMTRKKLPNGYWKDWNKIESYMREIIEKLGHFPTQKELHQLDEFSIPKFRKLI